MEIVKLVLVYLLAGIIILSGIMKLVKSPKIVEAMTQVGVLRWISLLGILEIVAAILFVFPVTRIPGFLLLACYFSGALATDLSHRRNMVAPFIILVLLFVTAFLQNPEWVMPGS